MKNYENKTIPHPLISVLPLAVLVSLIILVINIFPDDALSGASQVAMMAATAVCVALSMIIYKVKWDTFEQMIMATIGDAGVSILILLLIGMMSSTWMISGVVPTMIYYGVQFMSPLFFLPCACIISSLISVMTGTSWTTIATIGIALLGIGNALGVPEAYTAGAIISGAYFGDKMSPMSDTTVLASSVSGADLFTHIRYMTYTTVPSITISLILYLLIGLWYDGEAMEVTQYLTGLDRGFNISLLTLIVPAFTGYLIYKKVPSLITLILSSLSACLCAIILQPEVLASIAGETEVSIKSLFMGIMTTCYTKTHVDTGIEAINELVATRGMGGMLDTIWLILCAMCFGSCMVASNMLKSITRLLMKAIRNTFSLVASTVTSGVLLNLIMGDQFLSIIMNASMFKEEYMERGYKPELLSRSTEDSATVTSVLVPWTACGMTQSTVLGIPTIVYLPFCFFNIISPIMSCIVAALGYKIEKPVHSA
ncbi:MAG: sodium:proton antiporter [Prevotella sp.]|nr:sodium:proton antiporter [Candidatus Prevotella equi]